MRLHSAGYVDLRIIATPWVDRKIRSPLVPHRPHEPGWPCEPIDDFNMDAYGSYEVIGVEDLQTELTAKDTVIIGGAGILPEGLVSSVPCLNVHPGYIPYGRGLDSLKWSILKGWPVGVTAHLVDERTDAGIILFQKEVRVRPEDTFTSLAMRQYETEMNSFVPALKILRKVDWATMRPVEFDDINVITRRMPSRLEVLMLQRFSQRKLSDGSQ